MAATPNTGKTSTRYSRLIVGGHDLSGDMRSIGSIGVEFAQADATAWSDAVMQSMAGFGTVKLDGFTALLSNVIAAPGSGGVPVYAGSHTVLAGLGSQYASFFQGIRAAPAVGDPTFAAAFEQGGYTTAAAISDALTIEASFYGSGVLPNTVNVWGVALATGAEWAATTNGVSVDNGVATTNGFIAFLHLARTTSTMASSSWAFRLEHGTNDSTWATLGTFTGADGVDIEAVRIEGVGTVNRYVRLVGTRTAGEARPWCSFIRLP